MRNERGERWFFLRKVLAQGAMIGLECKELGYERYSARLDAAARERADEWQGDDETPITADWLRSVGFVDQIDEYGGCDRLVLGNTAYVMPHDLSYTPLIGRWYYGCCSVVPPTTRGAVRRLAAALSIPLAEGSV